MGHGTVIPDFLYLLDTGSFFEPMVLKGNRLGGWTGLIVDSHCIWDIISPQVCRSSPLDQIFGMRTSLLSNRYAVSVLGVDEKRLSAQCHDSSSVQGCAVQNHIPMAHVRPCIPLFLTACKYTIAVVAAKTPSTAQHGSDSLHKHSWNGLTSLPHEVWIFSISWSLPFSTCVNGPRYMRGWQRWQLQQKLVSA